MKICLLGEGAVGKTSIRQRFLGYGFDSSYLITLGADFAVKTIESTEYTYRFQIWDLAGQQSFSGIRDLYYRGSLGALIVFDLTRPETLPALENWVDGLYKHSNGAPLILLGNKADIAEETTISPDEITEFLDLLKGKRGFDVPYFETSAVSGKNIEEAFLLLGETIFREGKWEADKAHRWARARAQMREKGDR
ncbi:MAG: Rab family GTPase [Candidatus Odinarchaeota archaeon]